MKLNMKTLCSIGALLLCSESVLAMAEIRNENRSAYQMASISSDKKNESTGNVEVGIANFVAGMVSIHNIHLDNNDLSWIRDTIERYDAYIKVHDLLYGILDTGLNRQQCLESRDVYQNLLDSIERRRIVAENEAIESAVQMFEKAEKEAVEAEAEHQRIAAEDEAIESAIQMFEEAESEAARAVSQVIARESHYSRFGQFFKSMWSRFTNSRLGRVLKNIGQTLFSNR